MKVKKEKPMHYDNDITSWVLNGLISSFTSWIITGGLESSISFCLGLMGWNWNKLI